MREVKRVLVISDFNSLSSPGVRILDKGVVAKLEYSPYHIELYSESLEATLFSGEASQRSIRESLIDKYRDRKPDVFITVGPASLKFMIESHPKYFPDTPVVFCGSTVEMLDQLKVDSHFTGVWGSAQPEETLKAALHLKPKTKHVVVVGGAGSYDRELEAIAKGSFRKYESQLDFSYLTDLDMPDLLERLRHLPNDTIVYHTSIMRDNAGERFIDATQSVPLVAAAANAPVFTVDDVDVGGGTVGGDVMSFADEGRDAGTIAVRILSGEKPENIPIAKTANLYKFDWRALKRWGLKESDLPPGSLVLYRQRDIWESYKWYIVGGISLIAMEAMLIAGLIWQRARRRRTENELALTYERLRMAVEAGRSAGWNADLKNGRNRWFGDLQSIFGIPGDSYVTNFGELLRKHIHPEDGERVNAAIARARKTREPYVAEMRLIRTDGVMRWVAARGKFYFAQNGEPERMLGIITDITERKHAEEALNSLSGQLIKAQEEERSRIAREIHDDYQQRLAILAIDLENLAQNLGQVSDASSRLHELWNRVGDLGSDLHSLSHRLHSSTLDNLGLVAALRALCAEFQEYHSIVVNFAHENVPRGISRDVALCLFRITQEALQNIKKHSHADSAEVRVEALEKKIHLSVSDRGSGFDSEDVTRQGGIGIRSMEERVRLVGGQFAIHSGPTEGTRIDVWVPTGLLAEAS